MRGSWRDALRAHYARMDRRALIEELIRLHAERFGELARRLPGELRRASALRQNRPGPAPAPRAGSKRATIAERNARDAERILTLRAQGRPWADIAASVGKSARHCQTLARKAKTSDR